VADVKVRCSGIKPELHAKLVAAIETCEQVLANVDLDCAVQKFAKGGHPVRG
jgi:hypothetical protein